MLLDELPAELLPNLYRHLPAHHLWTSVRQVCQRLNNSLRRNEYWLGRSGELYSLRLPTRLAIPQREYSDNVTPTEDVPGSSSGHNGNDTGERGDDNYDKEEMMPSLRCVSVDRAFRRWSSGGLHQERAAHLVDAHVGTVDALRLLRAPSSGKCFCISGARDREIALWDMSLQEDGQQSTRPVLRIDNAHRGWIWCISVAPYADRFYSASWDAIVQQWHIAESDIQRGLHLDFEQLAALGCIAEGQHLLYVSTYKRGPILFDLRAGTQPQRQQNCHNQSAVIEMATGPDCNQIFSIGEDNRLVSVDKRQFEVLCEHHAPVSHVDYAEGQLCLSLRTGQLRFFDPTSLELENELSVIDDDDSAKGDCTDESATTLRWSHHVIRLTRGATFCANSENNKLRVYTPGCRPRLVAETEMAGNVTRLDALDGHLMAALGTGWLTHWAADRSDEMV